MTEVLGTLIAFTHFLVGVMLDKKYHQKNLCKHWRAGEIKSVMLHSHLKTKPFNKYSQ